MKNNNWKETTLGKIAKNVSRRFDFSNKEKVVFVNTGDVQEGKFLHKNYSKSEGLPGQAKKALKKGDILLSEIRPANNRYALVDFETEDYVVSTKFMVISGNELVDPRFLYLFLTSRQTLQEFQVIAESRSGTFPQITFDSIENFPILLPSLPEQKQIAAVLSSLDDKIELLRKQNETLEKIAQGIFKEWFVNFTIDGKKLKLKNGVPEGWKVGKIGDVVNIKQGKYLKENEISDIPINDKKFPIYGGGGIRGYIKDYIYEKPQVILTCRGNGCGLIQLAKERCTITNSCMAFENTNSVLSYEFLYFWAKKINFESVTSGSAQPQITITNLYNLEIIIPDEKILENFNKSAKPLFEKIILNNSQIQTLSRLRDTLLPKLMSGEILPNQN